MSSHEEQTELFGSMFPPAHSLSDVKSNGIRFDDWVAKLDEIASRRGVRGEPYSQQTGRGPWWPYYYADYTPGEALDEDWSYADEE